MAYKQLDDTLQYVKYFYELHGTVKQSSALKKEGASTYIHSNF